MDKWDAVLIPQTAADWSLVLTVLLHQPSPKLALITPEVNPPAAFYTKAQQSNQQSLTIVFLQYLQMPLHASLVTFDATFFPPANKIDDIALEPTELALQQTLTQDQLYNFVLKDAIRDLKGAGATLVVSSIDDSRAQLYWYYASEHKSKGKDLLASVVQTLLNRET